MMGPSMSGETTSPDPTGRRPVASSDPEPSGGGPATAEGSDAAAPPDAPPGAPADGPSPAAPADRPAGRHRWRRVVAAIAVLAAAIGLTSVTGLPAPGPLERYPVSTLHELVDAIHAEAGELRTPDDCWRTTFRARRDDAPDGPPRPIAAVDWLRSRVVVRVHADSIGRVDDRTALAVQRRLDAIVAAHPDLEAGMVVTEPSPDGWSPTMDCDRVTRGWL
jgi:hypothetical protein